MYDNVMTETPHSPNALPQSGRQSVIDCLEAAVREAGLRLESVSEAPSCLFIREHGGRLLGMFVDGALPLNTSDTIALMKDKRHTNRAVEALRIPKGPRVPRYMPYSNPIAGERPFGTLPDIESVVADIEGRFGYPVIVKPNTGSVSRHVFKATSRGELAGGVEAIFAHADGSEDCLIAQEYLEFEHEYRGIFVHGELVMLYEKTDSAAPGVRGGGPLEWSDVMDQLVADPVIRDHLKETFAPVLSGLRIEYTGADIGVMADGSVYLIELNSNPRFSRVLKNTGSAGQNALKAVFLKVLERVQSR